MRLSHWGVTCSNVQLLCSGQALKSVVIRKDIIDAWLRCLQMKEGQIEDGSAAWQAMSAADRTKRTRAAAEAKLKLKSPNFFVSRTRLCLRNLPHQISEKALKDLIIAAVGP